MIYGEMPVVNVMSYHQFLTLGAFPAASERTPAEKAVLRKVLARFNFRTAGQHAVVIYQPLPVVAVLKTDCNVRGAK